MNQPVSRKKSLAARIGGPLAFYTIVVGLVFSVGWFLHDQSQTLYERMALQGTEFQAKTLEAVRQVYSSDAAIGGRAHDVDLSAPAAEQDESMPLPVTLFREVGKQVNAKRPGARILLLSDYPFPSRKDRPPLDLFERDALQALRKSPDTPFYRFEDYEGRPSLRYAVADRMNAGCVACHNNRPDSPKRNWQVGDVRGIVEIVRPLDEAVASARAAQSGTFKILRLLILFLPLVVWRILRKSWRDEDAAANLRSAIIKIAIIIAVCEAILVCIITGIGAIPGWLEALLSAAVLIAVAVPVIYYRAIRPLSRELTVNVAVLDAQKQTLLRQSEELKKAHIELAANHRELHSRHNRLSLLHTKLEQANAQTAAALRESSTLRRVLDQMCIMSITDASGCIMEVNERFCEISGYAADELLGKNHRLVSSGRHPKGFWVGAWQTITTGGIWRGEVCNRRKDGTLYWLDSMIAPFRDADGRIERYIGVRFDITARKQMEQRLLESEQRMRLVIDNALDAVVVADSQGRITGWNAQAEQLFGYTRDEALGRPVSELIIPEELREAHTRGVARYQASGEATILGRRLEVPAICKDGQRKAVELAISAIRTSTDVWFSAFLRDVTERKAIEEAQARAQSAAEAASRSKSEFLANMSHEIRTPMTAILGYAELLAEDGEIAQDQQRRDELIRIIQRNGEHLLGIINDILDLSKVEAGKMSVESVPCAPAQLIEDLSSLMRVKVAAKGITWNVDYETPLPETIHSDPARLRQVLVNLVGNAIKFTEVGGVRLVCRLVEGDDPRLEFDVVDTGVGMTPQQQACLFQPFVQANSSMTRDVGGTGLGLAISKKFAELLGGDVTIVESTPGAGTRMRFSVPTGALGDVPLSIPNQDVMLQESPKSAEAVDTLPLQGRRILLAEDGPDNQRLIAFVLKKAGATVTVVGNGQLAFEEALAAAGSGRSFDAILMDMQMPVLDGYSATRLLRSEGYSRPIIALTAHAMSGDRDACLAAGCDDYATKPIHREQLISVIAQWTVRCAEAVGRTLG